MEFLNEYSTQIIIALIGLLVGITITVKIVNKNNNVTQKGNKVTGDMAGRDINKK